MWSIRNYDFVDLYEHYSAFNYLSLLKCLYEEFIIEFIIGRLLCSHDILHTGL